MGIRYTTREAVKSALDVKQTARADREIDNALDASTDQIHGLLRRHFRPLTATKSYRWPNDQYAVSWRLWIDQQPDQLISVASMVSGGVVIPASNFYLEPNELGAPYNRVEINIGTSSSWNSGTSTQQRAIVITGLWGYRNAETTLALTTATVSDTATALNVDGPTSGAIGVGDILRVDTERVAVVGRRSLDTTQTLLAGLAASATADGVSVTTGSAFGIGETLTLDTERMLIVDILGNTLVVKRGWDGSTLAAHTLGAVIYASRTLTLLRAQLGTTASGHTSGATVYRHDVPGLIRELAEAEAINSLLSGRAGWARTIGSGDNEQPASGAGLALLRRQAVEAFARRGRTDAI